MQAIISSVHKLTNTKPNTLLEIISELKSFLRQNDAEDLIVDENDIEFLLELCCIYSELEVEEIINDKVIGEINKLGEYKRIGRRLSPTIYPRDKNILTKIGQAVVDLNPDLSFIINKRGLAFIDNVNVVLSFDNLRNIQNMPNEYNGRVLFHRVKSEEVKQKIIPSNYLRDKTWVFHKGRYPKLEGRYFTTTELLDLVANRKVISYGNYN